MYGAGGWVAHHNTDLWRATAPIDGPQWGMWPTGGAWLAITLWDHYEYSGDREFLRTIYPLMKGAAQFFLDTLVEEPTRRWLVTSPSLSPENPHPFGTSLVDGPDDGPADPARPVHERHHGARELLDVDRDLQAVVDGHARAARAEPSRQRRAAAGVARGLGHEGAGDHHRHVSHLYGSSRAPDHVRRTPELAAAGRARSRFAATRPRAGPWPGASTCGRAWATAITPTRS